MCSKFVLGIDYRCTLKNAEFLLLISIVIVFFLFLLPVLFNSPKAKLKIGKYDSKDK